MVEKQRFTDLKKEVKKQFNIPAGKFYDMIGSSQSLYRRYENGTQPGFDKVILIARALPTLNLRWFILGEEPIWLDEEKKQVIDREDFPEEEDLKTEVKKLRKALNKADWETVDALKKLIVAQDEIKNLEIQIEKLKGKKK